MVTLAKREIFVRFLGIYLLTALISMGYFWVSLDKLQFHMLDIDEQYYIQEAKDLLFKEEPLENFRPMGFTTLLAGILSVTSHSLIATQLIVALLSCFRAPLTYLLARKVTENERVSLLAGVMMAFWPIHLYFSITLYSETVALPLFLLFLCSIPKREGTWVAWLFSGILLGLCTLLHSMFILFVPFIFAITWCEGKRLSKGALITCGTFVCIVPWMIASSLSDGKIVMSTNGGGALAGGLNAKLVEEGYQIYKAPDGRVTYKGAGMWTAEHGYLTNQEIKLPDVEKQALLYKRTWAWIKANPADALYLQWAKFLNMWGIYPLWWSMKKRLYLGNIPILFLSICSLLALVRFRSSIATLARLWTLPLFVTLVAMISSGTWRYRQPADAALIILSALMVVGTHNTIHPTTENSID